MPTANAPPILETARLRLTPITSEDAGPIFTLMRDAEVIAAADERGMAMVFTGLRHFRH